MAESSLCDPGDPVRRLIQLFRLSDSSPLYSLIREMSEGAEKAKASYDFTQTWRYADICFIVEDKKLFANKMILSMWSPVFDAMFTNNFKEKFAVEIPLPEKKHKDVLELLSVLHPPNKEVDSDTVLNLLPLAQEYQIEKLEEKCEEVLLGEASSVKNFLIAQKFNLKKLLESNKNYLRRAPLARLRAAPDFDLLEKDLLLEILSDKCEKFENNIEPLREVRMVLERKKPTTFPGMHLLCETCTGAREQQVDCQGCMQNCCKKLIDILRNLER